MYPKRLKQGHVEQGDCISADHYMPAVLGRLEHTYGREKQQCRCGTLFIDHTTGKIFNYCQFSNDAEEIIISKHHIERLAREEGFQIKGYHADNSVFASKHFKDDCETQE